MTTDTQISARAADMTDQAWAAAGYINNLAAAIHFYNIEAGWYTNLATGESLSEPTIHTCGDGRTLYRGRRNVPEMIALMHSELSEGLEGYRKNLFDDKLPDRPMLEVEFADAIIRILDTAAYLNLDVGGAIAEKVRFNSQREDHKIETRLAPGGKTI